MFNTQANKSISFVVCLFFVSLFDIKIEAGFVLTHWRETLILLAVAVRGVNLKGQWLTEDVAIKFGHMADSW